MNAMPAFEMKPKDNGMAALIAAAKSIGMSDTEISNAQNSRLCGCCDYPKRETIKRNGVQYGKCDSCGKTSRM